MNRIILVLAGTLLVGACDMPDGTEIYEGVELTTSQKAIAEAMIEGQKKASAIPIMRQREYLMAACYAKTVDMPSEYSQAHRAYLADFGEADKDYYGFFARYGLGEESAYSVFQRYEAAYEKCSPW
ncbi:hypothetical protein [Altererythrobacter sp. MF3-039]|uniref:hypothetical protein n=1 Tax=Altererythrobacter sp. MF3-039 TaxID=3252901 RepID=UPI00390C90B2